MLLSLILFGSKARGDDRRTSDTDLLGISDGGSIKLERKVRGVSQYRYPFSYLKSKAGDGDLFLAHLVLEGKALHDTANAYQQIIDAFQFKSSYEAEVQCAHAVIEFMTKRRRKIRNRNQRSRLIWAMRTILIARQAERGSVSFSSTALEEFSGIDDLKKVIDDRNVVDVEILVSKANCIADKFGSDFVHRNFPAEPDLEVKFLSDFGSIALDTSTIFMWPAKRRKAKSELREPLGYATFEPE